MQASQFAEGGHKCHTGSKQCCCGTPAGQSGCPKPGPTFLTCAVVKGICDTIGKQNIVTDAECEAIADGAGSTCEIVGLGPEDPLADICLAVVRGAIKDGCKEVVKQGEKYGVSECKSAAGCATSAMVFNTSSALVV